MFHSPPHHGLSELEGLRRELKSNLWNWKRLAEQPKHLVRRQRDDAELRECRVQVRGELLACETNADQLRTGHMPMYWFWTRSGQT